MAINYGQAQNFINRGAVVAAIGIYLSGTALYFSSFLAHWARYLLSMALIFLAGICMIIVSTSPEASDIAHTGAWASLIFLGVILLFIFIFGYGYDSSSALLEDAIVGNYIMKIDSLINHKDYKKHREPDDAGNKNISDNIHQNILTNRQKLQTYLWKSKKDHRDKGTSDYEGLNKVFDTVDKEILGVPGQKKDHVKGDLKVLVNNIKADSIIDYTRDFSSDRLRYCGGGKKKEKKTRTPVAGPVATATTGP
jgi:hypothetical protein